MVGRRLVTTLPCLPAMLLLVLGCSREPELGALVYRAGDLPGCQLAEVPAGAQLPCGVAGNPHVGTLRSEIECFGRMTLAA